VLDGLGDVPWRALASDGWDVNATTVPDLITALVTKARTPDDYSRIKEMLRDALGVERFVVDLAPFVVPFLVRWMMVEESEDVRATAIDLIEFVADPADLDDVESPEDREAIRLALVDAWEAIYEVATTATGRAGATALRLTEAIEGLIER
jgi:hypothetical protein